MKHKMHQHQEPKSRFEELDQDAFHQDLQPPDLYCDPSSDFCSLFGMLVSLVIAISVCFWLMKALSYNALKALNFANHTLDIFLLNLTNNLLFLNESFY